MELNLEQIIREYIDKSIHMSFATAKDNKPWVCELHFTYDDDLNLYFRSLKTRRHSLEIAANPFVAGNIVKQHEPSESPHGIYFEGIAKLCDDPTEFPAIYEFFKRRFGSAETIIEEAKREDGHQFYKVAVSDWCAFGKFGGDSNEKYHLPWKKS